MRTKKSIKYNTQMTCKFTLNITFNIFINKLDFFYVRREERKNVT